MEGGGGEVWVPGETLIATPLGLGGILRLQYWKSGNVRDSLDQLNCVRTSAVTLFGKIAYLQKTIRRQNKADRPDQPICICLLSGPALNSSETLELMSVAKNDDSSKNLAEPNNNPPIRVNLEFLEKEHQPDKKQGQHTKQYGDPTCHPAKQ